MERITQRSGFGFGTNQGRALFGKADDAWNETFAIWPAKDNRFAVDYFGDQAICGAKVDADDFTHTKVTLSGNRMGAEGFEPPTNTV